MNNDTKIELVFICAKDEAVIVTESTAMKCPECKEPMENAGWFEEGSKEW